MIFVFKKISFLLLLSILPYVLAAQIDTSSAEIDTTVQNISTAENDTITKSKRLKKKRKRKNKNDSIRNENDSIRNIPVKEDVGITLEQWLELSEKEKNIKFAEWKSLDSAKYKEQYNLSKKERQVLRKRKKNLSAGEKITRKSAEKKRENFKEKINEGKLRRLEKIVDKKIKKEKWLELSDQNQKKLLSEWERYDSIMLRDKHKYTPEEKQLFRKYKLSASEKKKLDNARKKPQKFREEMTYSSIDNLKKVLKFYKKSRLDTSGFSSMEIKQRHKIVADHKKIGNFKRAIKRHNTALKYDEKENKLRDKYKLTLDESKALNKGRNMVLKGNELSLYKRGKKKQKNFSEKLLKLRRERHNAMQDKKTLKRIKEREKRIKKNNKKKKRKTKGKTKEKKKKKKKNKN